MKSENQLLIASAAKLASLGKEVETVRAELKRLVAEDVSYESPEMLIAYNSFAELDAYWKEIATCTADCFSQSKVEIHPVLSFFRFISRVSDFAHIGFEQRSAKLTPILKHTLVRSRKGCGIDGAGALIRQQKTDIGIYLIRRNYAQRFHLALVKIHAALFELSLCSVKGQILFK